MINTKSYKLLPALVLGFIFTMIVGTISYQIASFSIAKFLGYSATIHYSSTTVSFPCIKNTSSLMQSTVDKYLYEIEQNLPFPNKNVYDNIAKKQVRDSNYSKILGFNFFSTFLAKPTSNCINV